jgi:hypothetical protein
MTQENKPLEKKIRKHLFDNGYHHIITTDEISEDGGETTSHIINNPQKNINNPQDTYKPSNLAPIGVASQTQPTVMEIPDVEPSSSSSSSITCVLALNQ